MAVAVIRRRRAASRRASITRASGASPSRSGPDGEARLGRAPPRGRAACRPATARRPTRRAGAPSAARARRRASATAQTCSSRRNSTRPPAASKRGEESRTSPSVSARGRPPSQRREPDVPPVAGRLRDPARVERVAPVGADRRIDPARTCARTSLRSDGVIRAGSILPDISLIIAILLALFVLPSPWGLVVVARRGLPRGRRGHLGPAARAPALERRRADADRPRGRRRTRARARGPGRDRRRALDGAQQHALARRREGRRSRAIDGLTLSVRPA